MRLTTCLIVLLSLTTLPSPAKAQEAQPSRLVQDQDLVPQYSFTIPTMTDVEPAWDGNRQECAYVQGTIAYNPARNSLFLACHDWSQSVAEISIPAGAGQATQLQQPRQVADLKAINPTDPNPQKVGGLFVAGDRLIVAAYSMYDGAGTQSASHFVRSTSLTSGGATGPIRIGSQRPHFTGGYMTAIPQEWRSAFGGRDLFTGLCCVSVISNTSLGPAGSVLTSASLLAATTQAAATPVVGYPYDHSTLGEHGQTTEFYSATSNVKGVVMVPGTNTTLFFGMYGAGRFCYGGGAECGDSSNTDHGSHNYPYYASVWAYRTSDLASVYSGAKQMWEIAPYARWNLPNMHYQISGAAYDAATGRLFVTERYGDANAKPRIHVFAISGTSGSNTPPSAVPDTTPPSVSLTAPGQNSTVVGSITLQATAADDTGVAGVWFTVDGKPVGGELAAPPYQQAWNSQEVLDGVHDIRAVTRDVAGNMSLSSGVPVTVVNLAVTPSPPEPPPAPSSPPDETATTRDTTRPRVSISDPKSKDTVAGVVWIAAMASDDVGVTRVDFSVGDVLIGSDTQAPFALQWDTTSLDDGYHLLRATATDAAGNTRTSTGVGIRLKNGPSRKWGRGWRR